MSTRFVLPFADVGSGIKPESGAQLFFFENKTVDTDKDTFTGPNNDIANSNPVISDANGLFPDIFIDGTYTVVLKDKNETLKWEADDVVSFLDGESSLIQVKFNPVPDLTIGDTTITLPDLPSAVNFYIDGTFQHQSNGDYSYSAGIISGLDPFIGNELMEVQYGLLITAPAQLTDQVGTSPNVTAMVNTDIAAGKKILTDGYSFPNDGGASEYLITSAQDFTGTINSGNILLNNGNIAVLTHNGTVYIEQFGVVGTATYSDQLNDAVNFSGVTQVLSSTPTATFDKIAFINQDNVTVDLSNTLITYIGDYDVYAEFGIGTDRSIGFINSRGVLGLNTVAVTSPIVDGTNVLTLAAIGSFAVDDYIQLNITYPRRVDEQVAKIIFIDGNDITIDYTFAWTVTSCTITNIATMRQNNHVKLNLFDNSAATVDANKISGVGIYLSANCSVSWGVENHNFPACIVGFSQDIELTDGFGTNPKDITPGRGYNCQINNSNRVNGINLVSRNCRHNWDSSGSSYLTLRDSHAYAPIDNISQYTTHGIYEHDILVENCYHYDGQNAFSIAQSGIDFGSQTRRFTIRGGRFNGLIKSENAKQFTMEDVDFYGTEVAEHEFAATEGTIIRDVKFNTAAQIRITVPADITGTDGIPSINDSILFENVDFNNNPLRTTNLLGSVKFLRCKNFGILSDSDLVDFYQNMTFEECDMTLVTGWEVKPVNSLIITDCTIDIEIGLSFSAGGYVQFSGGSLISSNSAIRLKFDSPVVTATDVKTENTTGIFAINTCKKFNLIGHISTNPDASHTSNQFTTEGTTDCAFCINGMNLDYTGSGNSILFINTGLQAIITGSYIEGTISFAGASNSSFAGNITPDTVLP